MSSVKGAVNFNLEITGSSPGYIVKWLALSTSLLWLQRLNAKSGKDISVFLYNTRLLYSKTPKVTKAHFSKSWKLTGSFQCQGQQEVKAGLGGGGWSVLSPGLALSSFSMAALRTESVLRFKSASHGDRMAANSTRKTSSLRGRGTFFPACPSKSSGMTSDLTNLGLMLIPEWIIPGQVNGNVSCHT